MHCVAVTYVGTYRIYRAQAFLELTVALKDGTEVSYLVPRTAAPSLLEGLTLAEKLARS